MALGLQKRPDDISAVIERVRRGTRNPDIITICDFAASKLRVRPPKVKTEADLERERALVRQRMKRYRERLKQKGKRRAGK